MRLVKIRRKIDMGVNHFALAMFISDSFFIREHIRNAWKTGSRSGRGYG